MDKNDTFIVFGCIFSSQWGRRVCCETEYCFMGWRSFINEFAAFDGTLRVITVF
jgi:hypothetical protein